MSNIDDLIRTQRERNFTKDGKYRMRAYLSLEASEIMKGCISLGLKPGEVMSSALVFWKERNKFPIPIKQAERMPTQEPLKFDNDNDLAHLILQIALKLGMK